LTRKTVVAMNTHLDDQGSKSRLEAAKIILQQITNLTEQGPDQKSPAVFLAGDFNSEPDQEAYNEMTSTRSPMDDLQSMVTETQRYGDVNTFSGFDPQSTRRKRIDFLFLKKDSPYSQNSGGTADKAVGKWWHVDGYTVLPNRFEDGVFNSDHQAVIGDVSLI